MEQSAFPERYWPLAAQHHAIALNLTKRFDTGMVPLEARFREPFTGLVVPFGAKVVYWRNPKQNSPETSKFSSTGVEGTCHGVPRSTRLHPQERVSGCTGEGCSPCH